MQCPVCDCPLKEGVEKHSETEIDYCPQCKGIWLDADEMERVCSFADRSQAIPRLAKRSRRLCPRCEVRLREFRYPGTMVEVNQCKKCKGMWLDAGELKEIAIVRQDHVLREQRQAAAVARVRRQTKTSHQASGEAYSRPDFSGVSKVGARIGELVVLLLILGFIASFIYLGHITSVEKKVEQTRQTLEESFAGMPNYEKHRAYIQEEIESRHESLVKQCTFDELVKDTYTRNGRHRTRRSYVTRFNARRYTELMHEALKQQARKDENKDVLVWLAVLENRGK